jgi:trans-2-enoyl-CoA reductase
MRVCSFHSVHVCACIGWPSALLALCVLRDGSSLVTYGGMSRKPVCVPTGRLIFNDVVLRGFWLSRWVAAHTKEERRAMIGEIVKMMRAKEFTTYVQRRSFDEFETAIKEARQGYKEGKVLLTMTK